MPSNGLSSNDIPSGGVSGFNFTPQFSININSEFILPSKECILPIFSESVSSDKVTVHDSQGFTKSEFSLRVSSLNGEESKNKILTKSYHDENSNVNQTPLSQIVGKGLTNDFNLMDKNRLPNDEKTKVVRIRLADCLACSGCLTTAETVLIDSQSREEVETFLKNISHRTYFLLTISEQSAGSIAAALDLSFYEAQRCIAGFFRSLIPAHPVERFLVLGTEWAQRVALQRVAEEYHHRIRFEPSRLPLLVATCPGWVCYCEKQYPELLPFLSTTLSPQGIAGSYIKKFLCNDFVYHLSIQPCFDRKLEAVRSIKKSNAAFTIGLPSGPKSSKKPQFLEGDSKLNHLSSQYTDCVMGSVEVLEWMRQTDSNMPWRFEPQTVSKFLPISESRGEYRQHVISDNLNCSNSQDVNNLLKTDPNKLCEAALLDGSGGYHSFTMQYIAHMEAQRQLPLNLLRYEQRRNPNWKDVYAPDSFLPLISSTSKPHRFAVVYGFQQIQNIVRGFRRNLPLVKEYTFIEIMACPHGCLNGGAQIRQPHHSYQETLLKVQEAFEETMSYSGIPPIATSQSDFPVSDVSGNNKTDEGLIKGNLSEDSLLLLQNVPKINRIPEEMSSSEPKTTLFSSDFFDIKTIFRIFEDQKNNVFDKKSDNPHEAYSFLDRKSDFADFSLDAIFHNRKKEMDEMLQRGAVNSLKW